MSTAAKPAQKPLLRGVSHQIAFFVSLATGAWLTWQQPAGTARWAVLVYYLCLSALFGISAAYHRPTWGVEARQWMRRLDHAGIYLQIAGTYTPICLLAVRGDAGWHLLAWVWLGAGLGMVKTLAWVNSPKALTALLYMVLSWAVVGQWSIVSAALGRIGLFWLMSGGVLYSLGALAYVLKRPNPVAKTFEYHEVFHVLVILAAACHCWLVLQVAERFAHN